MDDLRYPCLVLDKVTCRRRSDPHIVLDIWSAINDASSDGDPTYMESLLQHINKKNDSEITLSTFRAKLQDSIQDGLLMCTENLYSIPYRENIKEDGHDWYCFVCHKVGNVVMCNCCWRVYHPVCILKRETDSGPFVCYMCKNLQNSRKAIPSQLLAFVLVRLKNKTGPLHCLRSHTDHMQRAMELLVYELMDLEMIKNRVIANHYESDIQFEYDIHTILHNVAIVYGETSDMADLAKILLKDCRFELEEVLQCADCYYYSNVKPLYWFCYPCKPMHQLVFAKLSGYSYWPAKIITATPDGYNVRFFGTFHQRALIAEAFIRPIDTDRGKLFRKKIPQSLKNALDELDRHQDFVRRKVSFEMPLEMSQILQQTLQRPQKRKMPLTPVGNQPQKKLREKMKSWNHQPSLRRNEEMSDSVNNNHEMVHLRMLTDFTNCISRDDPAEVKELLSELTSNWCQNYSINKGDVYLEAILGLYQTVENIRRRAETRAMEWINKKMRTVEDRIAAREERFQSEISENKKKQWCYNCENPAQYYCCWNTSYCSLNCQRRHWEQEHRQTCRRVHCNSSSQFSSGS